MRKYQMQIQITNFDAKNKVTLYTDTDDLEKVIKSWMHHLVCLENENEDNPACDLMIQDLEIPY